jgi:aryl-alcohol dehydrogenase-like predicted oxidoreductase
MNMQIVEAVKMVATKYKATPAQIAIAWTLHKGKDIVPIPGTRHVNFLEENLGASKIKLRKDDLAALDKLSAQRAGERYEPAQMAWVDR